MNAADATISGDLLATRTQVVQVPYRRSGDADGVANGVIVDPAAPAVSAAFTG
jgi:hypothetical protein